MNNEHCCLECGHPISTGVYNFSTEVHGYPLCLKHQAWLTESTASGEAIKLYLALKSNKLPVQLEYWNGEKTIDIAIPGKLYIEVDISENGEQEQVLADFLDAFHNWKEGVPSFRILGSFILNWYEFDIIVEKLTEICMEFKRTG